MAKVIAAQLYSGSFRGPWLVNSGSVDDFLGTPAVECSALEQMEVEIICAPEDGAGIGMTVKNATSSRSAAPAAINVHFNDRPQIKR